MEFRRISPAHELKDLVECYWIMESEATVPVKQKIIPDGFPEIIFHFGDPYEVKLKNQWRVQPLSLVAGQISRYFYLRNTGRTRIFGIKMKPAGLTKAFNISMDLLTDKVIPLHTLHNERLNDLGNAMRSANNRARRIEIIPSKLCRNIPPASEEQPIDKAIASIFSTNGMISVSEICVAAGTGERQLERLFKKYVGLTPKFYARIIRFSNIFQVVQKKKMSFIELGLEAGYYDQAHFNKNFKAFTGEDPSRYIFDQANMANFFLKKQ